MDYIFSNNVRDNDALRASFNALTRQTFGFDFKDWYASGHWGDWYIPHVLLDGDRVISNVSVNLMQFDLGGVKKNYIQLGTVMTDEAYRGQGLNSWIMERILEEYAGKVDGIYLFANDDAVNYYPKFGFRPAMEYEYYLPARDVKSVDPYTLKKVDLTDHVQAERLYQFIRSYAVDPDVPNENDALYMDENISLYQFWFGAEFGDQIYYLPEKDAYIVAGMDEDILFIHQIFGKRKVDLCRVASALGKGAEEIILGFTPADPTGFSVRKQDEPGGTLFVLGEDLERIERDKMIFPVLSHA